MTDFDKLLKQAEDLKSKLEVFLYDNTQKISLDARDLAIEQMDELIDAIYNLEEDL